MASWKKIVVEDSTAHIAQTSALADHLNATGAGDRAFAASPEVLFQDAASETGSLAKGTADQWLRMNTAANALEWDSFDVAGDSGSATATAAGINIQTENALQITTAASGNTITIGFPDNVTIDGDLIVTGNNLTFGNTEMIDNVTDGTIKITADTTEVTGDLKVTGNDIKSSSGTPLTFSGDNTTVNGNLTVSGSTTTVNTETISLADNVIVLNSNHTGDATQDAGITVERGNQADQSLFWDESVDAWALGAGAESSNQFPTIYGYLTTRQSSTSNPTSGDDGSGLGSMWLNSNDQQAFIRTN